MKQIYEIVVKFEFFFFKIYLFKRLRECNSRGRGGGEADSPMSGEPSVGVLSPNQKEHDLSQNTRSDAQLTELPRHPLNISHFKGYWLLCSVL